MTFRIAIALFIVSSFWACGSDSVTTSEPPSLERGLHEVGNLTQPRYQHVATLLPDGKVLIAGGYKEGIPNFTDVSNRHISAEIFDPVTGTSSPTGNMTVGRSTDHGILLPDGLVLIIPRYHDFPIEIYDPHAARFNAVAKIPWYPPITTVNLLQSGKIFVTTQQHTAVFDPVASAFSPIVALEKTRKNHTATLLKDGRVLIVGGTRGGIDNELTGRNLIYEPSSNAFAEAGDLQVDRIFHKAVLLQDGRVLIIGGIAGEGPFVHTAEMYDPETNAFSPAGVSAIDPLAATLLPSGKVLLMRSINGDIALYNPATHEFSPTGHSIGWRSQPTVTLLADGRVMVAGGSKYKEGSTNSGHTFDEEITDQILIFTP